MKIAGISDTHNKHKKIIIPECDVLIHAGDWSFQGYKSETEDFAKWLEKQPAKHIIVVPGNHEKEVEKNLPDSIKWITDHCPRAHVLIDQSVVIDGVKFHGSPITPWFYNWAWNRARGDQQQVMYFRGLVKSVEPIKPHWDMIPDDTNVLITHGPVEGILDIVPNMDGTPRERVGCKDLYDKVMSLDKLKIHICGHIHHSHGSFYFHNKQFYNVSICDEQYAPSNPVTVIEY